VKVTVSPVPPLLWHPPVEVDEVPLAEQPVPTKAMALPVAPLLKGTGTYCAEAEAANMLQDDSLHRR